MRSHPTVRRRLRTLEALLGAVLVDHLQQGSPATAEATDLLAFAKSVEASMDAVLERHPEPRPSHNIRVLVPPDLRSSKLRLFLGGTVEASERHRPRLEGTVG